MPAYAVSFPMMCLSHAALRAERLLRVVDSERSIYADAGLVTLCHHSKGASPMTGQATQDLHGITQVKKVTTEEQTNQLLTEGWVLLGLFDRRDGNDQYVEYHLGLPSEPPTGFFG